MRIVLRPDGPHGPDYTRQVADGLAEAVRVLAYATRHGEGLSYPADVYDVLGHLSLATARLPQVLEQMGSWVEREAALGRAVEHAGGPHRGDTTAAIRDLGRCLRQATSATHILQRHLAIAQEAVSGMEARKGN